MGHDGAQQEKARVVAELAECSRVHRLDRTAAMVTAHLACHGVRSIVIKGPGTADLLYRDEFRSYCDLDLLVAQSDYERASSLVELLDFARTDPPKPGVIGLLDSVLEGEERSLIRSSDGVYLDLHRSFHGLRTRQDLLEVLWPDCMTIQRSGVELTVPSVPARMLLAILHGVGARHERIAERVTGDVHRVCRQATTDEWARLRALADQLGVTPTVRSVLEYTAGGATSDIVQRHFANVKADRLLSHHLGTGSLFSRWSWELRGHPVSGRLGWLLVPLMLGARPVKSAQQQRSKVGRGWVFFELKLLFNLTSPR
jgi:hypothetical protein